MKNRKISDKIFQKSRSKTGRIIVVTGARQTGKTTLIRHLFGDFEYISLEDPVARGAYARLSSQQWNELYPLAILDEVQKVPSLIETVKAVYDLHPGNRYILLGSSQLLLLEKVRESLAGRSSIIELYPFTLPEMRTRSWEDKVDNSLFQSELAGENEGDYLPSFLLDKNMAAKKNALDFCSCFGSYPAITGKELSDNERYEWLQDYVKTYLERDIRDLASFRDLDPFVNLQRYLAINTATLVNATDISKRLGISFRKVKQYIRYFGISYQVLVLPAWSANPNKRLSKMQKIHFLDNGVLQAVLQKRGGMTGNEFESLIVSEIYKQIKNNNLPARLYHLRTHDGREVDLIIEMPDHYYAVEIKMTGKINNSDTRHLRELDTILDKPLRKSFLLSLDPETRFFTGNVIAMHAAMFLG